MQTCPSCGAEVDAAGMCYQCQRSATEAPSRPPFFRTLGLSRSRPRIEEKARTLTFGRAGGDPQAGPFRVRVAAAVLHWPRSCACCCQKPGVTLPLAGRRWTGTRVVDVDTPSWEVPYCARCAEHVRLYRRSLEHEQAAGGRGGLVPIIVSEVLVGLVLAGVWLAVAAGQLGTQVATALTVGALLVSGAVTVMLVARLARRRAAAADAADAEFDRSAAGMNDRCGCPGEAVEYVGRDEAGHTFVLHNRGYAEAFTASNQGVMTV